ncbi:MAG: glutaredoxin domain-containing protein [Acidimicrobiia bacterium]
MTNGDQQVHADEDATVTVYWRKGCLFCAALRRRLRAAGVRFEEVDIWAEPSGAAYVRSVAGGNETVPTVRIGDRALVNPSAGAVIDLARTVAPDAVAGVQDRPGAVASVLNRLRGGRSQADR